MALRTALIIDGDSEAAQRALAELDRSLDQASASAEDAKKDWVDASTGLDRLRVAEQQAAAAGVTLSEEQKRAAMHGRDLTIQQAASAAALQRVTVSAGAQRAGMQQLAFQLGDVATMFAMGAPPMRIFASQGTQVIQSIGLMRGSAGGLIGFLSGPWGVAISAAAVVLVPLIERLFDVRDAADEAGDALRDAVKQFNSSLVQTSALSKVLTEASKARVEALGELGRINREINQTQGTMAALQGTPGVDGRAVSALSSRLAGLQAERDAAQKRADEADLAARTAMADASVVARQKARLDVANDDSGSTGRSSGAIRTRTAAISDQAKAAADASAQTDRYIASLEEEIAKLGLDAAGLRQLEVARATEAAQTDAQRQRIGELNQERERGLALQAEKARAGAIGDESAAIGEDIAALEREAQVIGLTGTARARALLGMEREAEIRPLLKQLADAEAQGQALVAKALRDQIDALDEKYALQVQIGSEADRLEAQKAAQDDLIDSYRQLGDVGVGALSAIALHGEDAGDVLERLAISIADAALQASLLGDGPLAGLFGGGGGGGLLGSLLGAAGPVNLLAGTPYGGGRANGGPVSPGQFYAVNETSTAPGLFFPLAPGRIEPPGNDNGVGGGVAVVRLALSADLDARIESVSGNVAVEVLRANAPAVVDAAVSETTRRLTRGSM